MFSFLVFNQAATPKDTLFLSKTQIYEVLQYRDMIYRERKKQTYLMAEKSLDVGNTITGKQMETILIYSNANGKVTVLQQPSGENKLLLPSPTDGKAKRLPISSNWQMETILIYSNANEMICQH
jgi:hypothetical protein